MLDERNKQLLTEFNEALRKQILETRKRVITLFNSVSELGLTGDFEVTGKCFLGYEYSKIHPVQTIRAKKMWAILNGSIDNYIPYLDDKLDNWNEGLDRKLTEDMHLIHPFHNLYSHMDFSIFDLLWVRDFNIEVNAEVNSNTYNNDDYGDHLDWDKSDYYD